MKTNFLVFILFIVNLKLSCQSNFWARALGGNDNDRGSAIAVLKNGNVITAGSFSGTADFDPGPGTQTLTAQTSDLFISVLSPTGNYVTAKQIKGDYPKSITDLILDKKGNIYTIGNYTGTVDFDFNSQTTYTLTSNGGTDIFVCKYYPNGSIAWGAGMGSSYTSCGIFECGYSLVTDNQGNVYATGHFVSTADFDPGPGTYNLQASGEYDIFICKLDSNGHLIWAKKIGGYGDDRAYSIKLDKSGNLYLGGFFSQTVDFDPGSGTQSLQALGERDAFICKLTNNGDLLWVKQFGGTGSTTSLYSLELDASDNIYFTGTFIGTTDFDPGPATFNLTSSGDNDVYIGKLNSSGNLVWAKKIGGTGYDDVRTLALDNNANVYIAGCFSETVDFDPGNSTYNITSYGGRDIYFLKLTSTGNFVYAKAMGGAENDAALDLVLDTLQNIYITGYFTAIGDFDPDQGTSNLISNGSTDAFVFKMYSNTGIPEINIHSNYNFVFPNPASDKIYISSNIFKLNEISQVQIFNNIGQEIFCTKEHLISDFYIDVSSYNPGFYIIKLTTKDGNIYSQKFFIN